MPRVLIVDDEEDMLFLLRVTIRTANKGLAVSSEASSGEEAIARWKEDRPEIIVLDNRMPGMTGLEVAEQILAEQPDQSIILFSAFLDDQTQAAAARLGIRACLAKNDYSQLPDALWRHAPAA